MLPLGLGFRACQVRYFTTYFSFREVLHHLQQLHDMFPYTLYVIAMAGVDGCFQAAQMRQKDSLSEELAQTEKQLAALKADLQEGYICQ